MTASPHFVPCGTDHALRELIVGVGFSDHLTQGILKSFQTPLGGALSDLPKIELTQSQTFQIEIGGSPKAHVSDDGTELEKVEWKRFANNGAIEWMLGIEKQRLFVSCQAYTRWRSVADKAYGYLSEAFSRLQTFRTNSSSIVSHTIDEFFAVHDGRPDPAELLNRSSRYVALGALQSSDLFHCNTGWFEADNATTRRLARVNIAALPIDRFTNPPAGAQFGVRIEIFLRCDPHGGGAFPLSVHPGSAVHNELEAMHERNKELLIDILSPEMSARIGLSA